MQKTYFPHRDNTTLTVDGQGPRDITLRVPAWVREGFRITVNGDARGYECAKSGTYYIISRT